MAPLRAINGFSKILTNDYQEVLDDEGLRILNIITNNSKKMGRLIDDLMTYSNLGRKNIALNIVNTQNVVQEYLYETRIDEDRLNIKSLYNVKGDKVLIKLVFGNLINNALKFSAHRKNPKIEIGSKENANSVEFYVKDNGIGFDMAFANKIFGLFEKLHPETKYDGTGVGLAMVLRIVNNHKGKVWVESKLDQGSTFYFSIPK